MAEMNLVKYNDYYAPADEESLEISNKIAKGKTIKVKYSFPRNPGNHKRIFAFFKVAFDVQDHFASKEVFRKWLIMKSGFCEMAAAPNGEMMYFPESLKWDSMDEIRFREVFSAVIDTFLSVWGSRITKDKLMSVIEFV